jgi:hypothetical protein
LRAAGPCVLFRFLWRSLSVTPLMVTFALNIVDESINSSPRSSHGSKAALCRRLAGRRCVAQPWASAPWAHQIARDPLV